MRRIQNNIYSIYFDESTLIQDPDEIAFAFVNYYKNLLGSCDSQRSLVSDSVVKRGTIVEDNMHSILTAQFSDAEIKKVMLSIDGNKSPGPDGFTSQFFKDTWEIVGNDICLAVKSFFSSRKLLKQLNASSITLIPKVSHPSSVTDFRPIS